MKYSVVIHPSGERDIEAAYCWLLEEAPESAAPWFNGLEKAISSLSAFPKRCPVAPENESFSEEIRQLLYGKRHGVYRVLFTIAGSNVHILHCRHGSRRLLEGDADSV